MDRVPVTFCRDVTDSLSFFCNVTANRLSGTWNMAGSLYASNVKLLCATIGKHRGEWFYRFDDNGVTLEELLKLPRRCVVFHVVYVCCSPVRGMRRCSKKYIEERLVPFICVRTRVSTGLFVVIRNDVTLAVMKMFRAPYTFGRLSVSYCGPGSEEFLLSHLENNDHIRKLEFYNAWPHRTVLEEQLVKHLRYGIIEILTLHPIVIDDKFNFRVTFAMLKALFDVWASSENSRNLCLSGSGGRPTGVTVQDIISMPVPTNVERTLEDLITTYRVLWTKQNGCTLHFEIFCVTNQVTITSRKP
uniref:F-box domain-containing protein n=1 Tax=Steinernema glaseri TaxID=37863 RepID=A0A1I7Z4C1_9BILA